MSLLHYLAVGRLAGIKDNYREKEHCIIASVTASDRKSQANEYQSQVMEILVRGASKLVPDKRLRLNADDEKYDIHVIAHADYGEDCVLVYFAITNTNFGESFSVRQMLTSFKQGFLSGNKKDQVMKAAVKGHVHSNSQQFLNSILTKYGSSKLANVQGQVDQVKGIMQDNVTKALNNVDNLNELEDKSAKFEAQAKRFEKQSTQVKKMMRCGYYKTILIMVLVGIALIALVIGLICMSVGCGKKNKDDAAAADTNNRRLLMINSMMQSSSKEIYNNEDCFLSNALHSVNTLYTLFDQ